MRRSAKFHRDLPAVTSEGRTLTFGQAWDRGIRLANALISLGVKPGDRVAVLEDNCIEAADFYLAAAIANIVRVPLYRRNSVIAHEHMITHTDAKVVVVSAEYAHELAGLDAKIPGLTIVVRDENYNKWLELQDHTDPDPAVDLDDVFIIRHSAGTTGKAKGIAYTHRAWMSATRDWFYMLPPVDLGDRCLHVGPISHGSGYLFLPIWLAGGCNILAPKFDAASFVATLVDEKVGYLFAVPTMIADIVAHAGGRRLDLPHLKSVLVSGAPISEHTALAGREVLGDTLYQLYGQTEAVPVAMMGPREWFGALAGSEPLRAAGRVMPFAELEIRDDENRSLPVGEAGEIAIRCEGQMTGLWNDIELTERRLRDGWVLTGDIGRLDEHGFLYIVDRVDDMIVSGGFNIWPTELEQAIAEIPGVREVVVVGIPHEKWGEAPMAMIYADRNARITDDTVIAWCREKLGSYKKPSQIMFIDEPLPRSPVGKIQRKVIREPYWAGHARRVSGS
ncbi:AMP-dependent synthetase [Mycobacterium saskatchewanense]|uniref:AMP-dependent synthetase n=2 Tax=Mycobacterium saskatchewanense TaxID=220927 RepID=A0AAJ3NTI2_9MYCO|nr:AMP-dependent synthetase [Mycobacterium saskatchewanense]BBX65182.1 AMP-dependent synthetase [Mycobacterium saskatchewanense]